MGLCAAHLTLDYNQGGGLADLQNEALGNDACE